MRSAYATIGTDPISSSPPAKTQSPSLKLHIVPPVDSVFTAQIRALQGIYPEAHRALINWGAWSRDLRNVYPPGVVVSPTWREALPSKFGDFADEDEEGVGRNDHVEPAKAEALEREPYDELAGRNLDERMHGPGGLSVEVRVAMRVAYLSRETPEEQFPRHAGCNHDAFRERLETALRFVMRFA